MDSRFISKDVEEKIYDFWEKNGYFLAKVNPQKSIFSIILPPPNANADLHLGHAMYVYEDIMIRFKKLSGFETLWLPGADHAGLETQFVFEQQLKKEGKSRFDFDRSTLYKMIWDFVTENKSNMLMQLRRLGFALDWSKNIFTLDPKIISIVYKTFKKLYDDGLVYRDKRLVNYCVRCGTSFSDLEVNYVERKTSLYYLKYGPFVLATTRPETKFGDTAVAVNPDDRRYKKWIGQEIEVVGLTGKFRLKVIADSYVDPEFGTGVVKVTPAHDFDDFEVGKRHGLEMLQVINFDGKLNKHAGKYEGLFVTKARKIIVEDLNKAGLIDRIKEDYLHRIGVCYKCGTAIEPLPLEQWFVKVKPLTEKAKDSILQNKIKFHPQKYKKIALDWLRNFHDWNISRQIIWGISIPAYECKLKVKSEKLKVEEKWFVSVEKPMKCQICGKCEFEQDTDTFDTWFSSSMWPFATLKSKGMQYFNYFYPTSVMETGYDILPWWVCRMIMMGIFKTGKEPFKLVYLHGLVRDSKGQKMSKSKGNVINPMTMIDKYGADALRAALVFEVGEGADISFTEDRIVGMRNFANKVWNIGRFIFMNRQIQNSKFKIQNYNSKIKILVELKKEFLIMKKDVIKNMESYKFSAALGEIYEFLWHELADYYIEELKGEVQSGNIEILEGLKKVYLDTLILLHPFMPFVTEAVWKEFKGSNASILNEKIKI